MPHPQGRAARTRAARSRYVVALLLGCLAAVGVAAPASAHAILVGSTPAAGRVLAVAPAQVVLVFSEQVTPVPGRVSVVGPDGQRVEHSPVQAVDRRVLIPLGTRLSEGTYLVSYRIVSADGHPVAGGFTFVVGRPSSAPRSVPAPGTPPVIATAVASARVLGYLGIALLVGIVVLTTRPTRRAVRLLALGWVLVLLGTLGSLAIQVPYTGSGWGQVLSSRVGVAYEVRLAVLLLAVPALRALPGRRAILGVLLAVGLVTWPLSGHPGTTAVPVLSVAADLVHLVAVSVWLAGLVALLTRALSPEDEQHWPTWAARAVGLIAVTGVVQGILELGPPVALVTTTYGRLLLVKVGLFAAVLGLGALARNAWRTRESGHLRRAVTVEVGVLALVLVVTSMLGLTTPGREASQPDALANQPYAAELASPLYRLRVEIDPARVGPNSVHLFAIDRGGAPLRILEWHATITEVGGGVGPVDVPLRKVTADHEIADLTLPAPGRWDFRFTLRTSDFDQASVTARVPVSA